MEIDFGPVVKELPIWQVLLVGIAFYLAQKLIDWCLGHTWYSRTEKAIGMLLDVQALKDDGHITDISELKNSIYKRINEKNIALDKIPYIVKTFPFLTMYILLLIVIGIQMVVSGFDGGVQPWMLSLLSIGCIPVMIIDILFQRFVSFLGRKLDGIYSVHYEKQRMKRNEESREEIEKVVEGAKLQIIFLEDQLRDLETNRDRCLELLSELKKRSNKQRDFHYECVEILARLKEQKLTIDHMRNLTEGQIAHCNDVIDVSKKDCSLSGYLAKVIEAKLLFSEQLKLI